jgi:hypothetical protein
MKKSAEILEQFLELMYMNNPEMDSPDMSSAIRDLLTDLLHIGVEHDVIVRTRLDDAFEVYANEAVDRLNSKTKVGE